MTGIRIRTTTIAAGLVLLVLSVFGATLVAVQVAVLTESVDEALAVHSERVAVLIAAGATVLPDEGDEDSFAVVRAPSGQVEVSSSRVYPGVLLPAPSAAGDPPTTVVADDGEAFRVLVTPAPSGTITVASPLDDARESAAALRGGLLLSVPLTTALLATGVWILVGRVLGPVEAIRGQVAEIGEQTLSRRVPQPRTQDEIARLARTMNEMLDRVERAAQQQQQFVADASHELRGPLARMRADLDIEATHPTRTGLPVVFARLRADVTILQSMVDDLLVLATLDGDPASTVHRAVDLDDVVFDQVAALRARLPAARIDTRGVTAARVHGKATALARVVANLLENALTHGAPPIIVRLGETDDDVVLEVSDAGPGIAPADAERIFDRFVRLDQARTPGTAGTGLGLAIVRAVVRDHGGTVQVDAGTGGGAQFTVHLPRGIA